MNDLPLLNKRNGLPQAAKKIRTRPLRIAYIGGSNTVMKEGWRPRFHPWMDIKFPQSQPHTEINLSIGAIGTLAASFLIPENLTGQKPDLAIIEYTINDFNWMSWEGGFFGEGKQPASSVSASLEGVVRMIKRENPECDILLVHMPLRDQLTGKFPLVTGAVCEYEKIAGYYGLPSLFAPGGFRALENSGAIQSTDYQTTLFRDEAHLSPAGLDYFLKMLEDSVTELLSGKGRTASLPVALNRITTEKARPIPVEPWMIAGPFTEEHFHNSRFDVPYLSLPPGSRLNITYKGVLVGLGAVFGPDTPKAYKANLNGRENILEMFTAYCTKPHLGSIILDKNMSEQTGILSCEAVAKLPDYDKFPNYTPPPEPVPVEALRLNITHLMLLGEVIRPKQK